MILPRVVGGNGQELAQNCRWVSPRLFEQAAAANVSQGPTFSSKLASALISQNRYPSPSTWSGPLWVRPHPFLRRREPARDAAVKMSDDEFGFTDSENCGKTLPINDKTRGSTSCKNFSGPPPFLSSSPFRGALKTTCSVPLSAPVSVPLRRVRPTTTRSSARPLVPALAPFRTISRTLSKPCAHKQNSAGPWNRLGGLSVSLSDTETLCAARGRGAQTLRGKNSCVRSFWAPPFLPSCSLRAATTTSSVLPLVRAWAPLRQKPRATTRSWAPLWAQASAQFPTISDTAGRGQTAPAPSRHHPSVLRARRPESAFCVSGPCGTQEEEGR